jgi:hypothetical protein
MKMILIPQPVSMVESVSRWGLTKTPESTITCAIAQRLLNSRVGSSNMPVNIVSILKKADVMKCFAPMEVNVWVFWEVLGKVKSTGILSASVLKAGVGRIVSFLILRWN